MKQCAIMYINMEYIFSCKYEICFIRIVRGIDIFWEAICLQFCAFFYNKKKKRRNMPVHWYLFIEVSHQSILFLTRQRKLKHQLITTLNSTSVWMVSSA